MSDPILNDLSRHMHERVTKVVEDYFERISWSGRKYERDQLCEHLGMNLLTIAATVMKAKTQTTLDEFIKAAYTAYAATPEPRK